MDKEKFHELFVNPALIQNDDVVQLQRIVKDHPYFQNAHLLLLFVLHQINSEDFKKQLNHSALYLSNRSVLINSILHGWPDSSISKSENIKSVDVPESPDKDVAEKELEIETTAIKEKSDPKSYKREEIVSNGNSLEENSFSLEDTQPIESIEKKEDEIAEKQGNPSDLLEFDLTSSKPEEDHSEDLIDYFLKVNPRIVPKLDLEDTRGDISIPGLEENDEIVTETLADIYEQQGHFLKAKDAYNKLILKFPEKSAYFASRIQELEKRIK